MSDIRVGYNTSPLDHRITSHHRLVTRFGFSIPPRISAIRYISSMFVGFKHLVIALHALLSSGSSIWACGDLAHTRAAYSAV